MEWDDYQRIYGPDPMQRQLSVTQKGLRWFAKGFWKIFIYSPLLFTGYWICSGFLERKDSALLWIGGIIGCALLIYQFLFFLKGILIALRERGNLLWWLLLLICVAFTCVLPAYLAWHPAVHLAAKLKTDESFARIMVIILGAYIYTRYNFHEPTAPKMASGAFRTGWSLLH